MRINRVLALLLASLLTLMVGCGQRTTAPGDTGQGAAKIKVVASVYPVYEFVRQVGGNKVDVTLLVPAGAEPHEWEPAAKDLVNVKNAKVFFYHGANFESWINKVTAKDVLGSTIAVEISKNIERKAASHSHAPTHEENANSHGHEKAEDEFDPHIWLDPVLAQQEVLNIAEALAAADAPNAEYYRENAAKYNIELHKLHEEYQTGLHNLKHRTIITNHTAFGYLAARYNLEQEAIMGLSPDAEPTADKMAEIVRFCREHQVKYIFTETLVSPRVAETVAKEAGAKVLTLHPVDALTPEEVKQGQSYLKLMRQNLENLKKALM